MSDSRVSAMIGLSPRVRGNQSEFTGFGSFTGSIPACAGEPPSMPSWMKLETVYPRVCGGTRRLEPRRLAKRGLSPRVRGNRRDEPLEWDDRGSIPACAGEP